MGRAAVVMTSFHLNLEDEYENRSSISQELITDKISNMGKDIIMIKEKGQESPMPS